MSVHFADDHLIVHIGDCREVMAGMEAGSVHCVVTSPPYWGLRDYGTATWEGGDATCDHLRPEGIRQDGGRERVDGFNGSSKTNLAEKPYRETCRKCGARRIDAQLGLEPTPEEYVANVVAVFREVRRVLRDDGTVWLNLGDSYAPDHAQKRNAGWKGEGPSGNSGIHANVTGSRARDGRGAPPGLKPKDLVGIPWRVAFALQADGWYLRSDIIWAKPNPMPESVTDRPTKAHEYLFLLSKSARYWYDADAVREERDPAQIAWREKYAETIARWGQRREEGVGRPGANSGLATQENGTGRNLRSVWTIATQPYPGAHFATFPERLVEPCVKAGTSERGVCPECGAPWSRVVERLTTNRRDYGSVDSYVDLNNGRAGDVSTTTTGWRPDCAHDAEPVPATVLDPFAGSGTTGRVANRLGRRAVLIDLSADYIDQAMLRNAQAPLGLGA